MGRSGNRQKEQAACRLIALSAFQKKSTVDVKSEPRRLAQETHWTQE